MEKQKDTATEREQKLIEQLETNTKLLNQAQNSLDIEMKKADKTFAMVIDMSKPEEKAKALLIKQKVDTLLAKLKAGGDQTEIIKQLNALAIK